MSLEKRIVSREDESDAEILKEDQDKINEFARLHAQSDEIEEAVKSAEKRLQDCDDAGDEIMMQDDDTVMYSVGDCFMLIDNEDAEETIEEAKVLLKEDADKLRAKYTAVQERMSELRAVLYAKFGKSIRLE
eukprot:TRINITY_DN8457_c0_g1_i1.p1 TRINITY_DN8457_c0_g1~~TRINITY_DN8457_c0_g1_i1.p1  ORF type:complete len:132 (+),score=40.69 TRINITY_DN8457_c0_g1_i1:263-658(+)